MREKQFRIPQQQPEVSDRKAQFADLNEFVRSRHGWLTSVPGAVEVTMETLVNSTLADELRDLGYNITETGEGERILPGAIVEKFVAGPDGVMSRWPPAAPDRSR
jgi:hypothetical protein